VAHLGAVTEWARGVRKTLEPIATQRAGAVHFRPSSGGVAMVGLRPDRPQRGRSGFRDLDRLARDFDALYTTHCVTPPHGRPTPEKRLQSWLTADAYRHERRMMAFDSAVGESTKTIFVGDELALPVGEKRRIVCDVLALRMKSNGECAPAVIELKAAREMTRLVEQVQNYAACIDGLRSEFERLYSTILGRDIVFDGPVEQWIVWPQAGVTADPREDALAKQGIRLVGYREEGTSFALRAGRTLP